jgi:hypothetical protein
MPFTLSFTKEDILEQGCWQDEKFLDKNMSETTKKERDFMVLSNR